MYRFFEESYDLVHKKGYRKKLDRIIKAYQDDSYDDFLDHLRKVISNDSKEAENYYNRYINDQKELIERDIRSSIKRFQYDYCKLVFIWIFDEIAEIYHQFFHDLGNFYGVDIKLPEHATKRGNPNFKKKGIPNNIFFKMVQIANQKIIENDVYYKPRRKAKSSTAISDYLEGYQDFLGPNKEMLYSSRTISENFRKRTVYENDKFKMATEIECKGIIKVVYS